MHLQIRKKEKYLLFSMVCYLLIVSSALFLIFFPVSGYTLLNDYTMVASSGEFNNAYYIYTNDIGSFYANVTKVQIDGQCYSSGSTALTGSDTVTFNGTSPATPYAVATFSWSRSANHAWVDCSFTFTDIVWISNPDSYNYFNVKKISNNGNILSDQLLNWKKASTAGRPTYNYGYISDGTNHPVMRAQIWGGGALPDAPVINNVMLDEAQVCLQPNESAALISDVTGTVDTWIWQILNSGNNVVSNTSDPVMTVTSKLQDVGNYTIRLTVINSGGSDSMDNSTAIRVNQPGTCNFTPYNPFPTISTTPTQNVFVTMTMPPAVLVNMTGVNDMVNNSYLGNWSLAYRQDVDRIGEGFNTTLVGVVSIVQSPLTMIVNGVAEGVSLFSVSINSLMSYTTIPLAIVGITLSYYPWQIITLITAGIAIDAVFILIFGVRR